MTAKERLRELVDGLDEDAAEDALLMLADRLALTAGEIAEIESARAAVREGQSFTTEQVVDYLRSRR
jgi:hypothetical protein